MNRIDKKFKELKANKKKAFIAFITAGDPSLKTTEEVVLALEKSGADIVELGVPFSDPLADGPTIQAASQRALKKGITIDKILNLVKRLRKKTDIPIALMTYYNPVFHYNESKFICKAKDCGVDGLIIPDLPPEEGKELSLLASKNDISTIYFITPTTTLARQKFIAKNSTGFIYYVSLTGVTGARASIPKNVLDKVRKVKKITDKPVCVGFGVSSSAQVKSISRIADGVIVGSAIVKEINRHAGKKDCAKRVGRFVKNLIK